MKYLNSRNNYLMSLNDKRQAKVNKNLEHIENRLILETGQMTGSGVMGNEIRWGDCLLGRLIHSLIRKGKVGVGLIRINDVIKRLRAALDEILLESGVVNLVDVDKKQYAKALVSEFLYVLRTSVLNYDTEDAVDEYDTIDEIKSLTDSTILQVERIEDLEGKNELILQLENWKKFLAPLKEDKKEPEVETEGEPEVEKDTQGDKEEVKKDWKVEAANKKALEDKVNSIYFENFKSVARLFLLMKKAQDLKAEEFKKSEADKKIKDSKGAALAASGAKTTTPVEEEDKNLTKVTDSYINNFFTFLNEADYNDAGESIAGVNPKTDQKKQVSEIEKALSVLYTTIKSNPDSFEDMKKIIALNAAGSSTYSAVGQIYKLIRNKLGLKSMPEMANENVDDFLSRQNKSLADQISAFYTVSKNKVDGSFPEIKSPEIKKEIATFNTTMKACLSPDLYKVEKVENRVQKESEKESQGSQTEKESQIEPKSESLLKRYSDFMTILEADKIFGGGSGSADTKIFGSNDDSLPDVEHDLASKIKSWWDKNINFDKWVLDKTAIDLVIKNLDKKIAEKKDSVVIQGMDPILEIVKCFNRAYKIHTTQVIPSGRGGGKVTNSIFMEYTSFGSGTPDNAGMSGGPYRNNKTFDKWESAVQDVLADREYQKIFNVGTSLKVGAEIIDKAGMNLRKFMNELLDGSELYKTGDSKEGGAQSRFLDKYFGYKDGTDPKNTNFDGETEREAITENADGVKNIDLKLVDSNTPIVYNKPSDLKNTFFIIKYKKDEEVRYMYSYIQDVIGGRAYISFCNSAFHILEYMKKSTGRGITIPVEIKSTQEGKDGKFYKVCATTVDVNKLYNSKGGFGLTRQFKMSHIEKALDEGKVDNKNTVVETKESTLYSNLGCFHVVDKTQGAIPAEYKRLKLDKGVDKVEKFINAEGGYPKITTVSGINGVKIENY